MSYRDPIYDRPGRPKQPALPIPTYHELVEVLVNIPKLKPRHILTSLYACGKRLEEQIIQIRVEEDGRITWLSVLIKTLKNPLQKERRMYINLKAEKDIGSIMWDVMENIEKEPDYYKQAPRTIQYWMKRYIAPGLGRREVHPHWFRRVRCEHVSNNNEELGLRKYEDRELQKYFGWKDPRSLFKYMHVRSEKLREANII